MSGERRGISERREGKGEVGFQQARVRPCFSPFPYAAEGGHES